MDDYGFKGVAEYVIAMFRDAGGQVLVQGRRRVLLCHVPREGVLLWVRGWVREKFIVFGDGFVMIELIVLRMRLKVPRAWGAPALGCVELSTPDDAFGRAFLKGDGLVVQCAANAWAWARVQQAGWRPHPFRCRVGGRGMAPSGGSSADAPPRWSIKASTCLDSC